MKRFQNIITTILTIIAMTNATTTSAQTLPQVSFERIEGFPSQEKGIEKGVSACFAGTANGYLIMAGGCNFPKKPAAEKGPKKYYQGIYAARLADGRTLEWKRVGKLPLPCAYGVTVQLQDKMLCIGGNNADQSMTQVLEITMEEKHAMVKKLPSLPVPMDNFTGCSHGDTVAVYNGEHLFMLDLQHPDGGWTEQPVPSKEKIGQPVSAFVNGKFHTWGGSTAKTECKDATLRIDGTVFDPQFSTVAPPVDDQDEALFLGGGTVINLTDSTLLAIGGVNKDVFLEAVNHPQPGYMTHPVEWYRFNPYVSLFDGRDWHNLVISSITARAGAALVKTGDDIYIIGGELKPGIRTPEIYKMTIE